MSRINDSSQTLKNLNSLAKSRKEVAKTQGQMASGKRITRAGDDAAALSIASKLDSRVASTRQATRNASESISILQVMEGSISGINDMLIRMRELAIQSASDTVGHKERALLHQEASHLISEVSRLAKVNQHNEQSLMIGEDKKLEIQLGVMNDDKSKLVFDLKDMAQTSYALGIYDISLDTQHHAGLSLYKIDSALRQTSKSLAKIGGFQSRVEKAIGNLETTRANLSSTQSRIEDADYAQVTADNTKNKIMLQNQLAVHSTSHDRIAAYLKLLD